MRRKHFLISGLIAACALAPAVAAYAQQGGDDEAAKKAKSKEEWNLRQAPLPGKRNAGPCPYVKVLYDAARWEEFKDNQEASGAVAYTGEIEGLTADCSYKGDDPIHLKMQVNFALGRGPQGHDPHKTYRYWVAVTERNKQVLAKQYFDLPITFQSGADRIRVADKIDDIVIPRANARVAGDNFEVLVGFDVTPEMADFNREGKRFRINAGAPQVASTEK
jgi:hypothetical protein